MRALAVLLALLVASASAGCLAARAVKFRDADHRISDTVDIGAAKEVVKTYEFVVPAGTKTVRVKEAYEFGSETTIETGRKGHLNSMVLVTPNTWESDGSGDTAYHDQGVGAWEIRITTRADASYVFGIYFERA